MKGMSFSKKFVALFIVACLSVLCCGLAACGSSGQNSSAASGSASSSSSSANVKPTDKFIGSWNLAAAESQGLIMSGNFSEMMGLGEIGMFNVKADGTGDLTFAGETVTFTWTEAGNDAITLKLARATGGISEDVPVTYADDALKIEFSQDGQTGALIYTKDGEYSKAKKVSLESAKPITSESQLLGTWKLAGMKMMGITIYGDEGSLAAMTGGTDSSITFEQGGVLKSANSSGTWAVDANGATATVESALGSSPSPLLMQDNMLL